MTYWQPTPPRRDTWLDVAFFVLVVVLVNLGWLLVAAWTGRWWLMFT